MKKFSKPGFLFLMVFLVLAIGNSSRAGSYFRIYPDTLPDEQELYNGRVWKNLYYSIENHQFLFTKEFLPATVTINKKTFKNLWLRYDIFNDEIIIPSNTGGVLNLNKELVDSFTIFFGDKERHFSKIDNTEGLDGFAEVLYSNKTALYVKFGKKIEFSSTENSKDNFYEFYRIYFVTEKKAYLIQSKKDFYKLPGIDAKRTKEFIRKNKLTVTKKYPDSFIPVIKFCEGL
ncbi:MAG: hypothetical protein U0W24_26370 [Bacteroidales bacterium]